MKITLMSGRAHLKHTPRAVISARPCRAIRQEKAKSAGVFCLSQSIPFPKIPGENVGRALSDIQKMCGTFEPPGILGNVNHPGNS